MEEAGALGEVAVKNVGAGAMGGEDSEGVNWRRSQVKCLPGGTRN